MVQEKRMKKGKAGTKMIQRRMNLNQAQQPPFARASSAVGGAVRTAGQQGRHGQICMVSSTSESSSYSHRTSTGNTEGLMDVWEQI